MEGVPTKILGRAILLTPATQRKPIKNLCNRLATFYLLIVVLDCGSVFDHLTEKTKEGMTIKITYLHYQLLVCRGEHNTAERSATS